MICMLGQPYGQRSFKALCMWNGRILIPSNLFVRGAGTRLGPLGQAGGSPVAWVSTEPPSLTVPPFSSSSLLLQYSSASFPTWVSFRNACHPEPANPSMVPLWQMPTYGCSVWRVAAQDVRQDAAQGEAFFPAVREATYVPDKAWHCFAGAGLEPGTYQAALIMYSNDPEQPITRLPLQLEVS